MKAILRIGAAALALSLFTACATRAPAIDYAALVEAPGRPDADIVADLARKPADVLALFSPQPGDAVLEIEAGAGYYTELLSRAVGAEGRVFMQNPAGFDAFLGDAVSNRIDGRLANVQYLKSNFDFFVLDDEAVDIVTWFQGPHELWYKPKSAPEGLGDPDKSFLEIARVLKSGGTFIALDHVAPAGAPATTGGDTHRIDPALIRQRAEAVGLVFVAESDLLRSAADDGLKNVFDPAIRGKTSQAILIFRKP
jgi:predicted methyltransferase